MNLKKYQVAIISFALGIFALTFFISWFVDRRDVIELAPDAGLEYANVKAFFANTREDPNTLFCDRTYPVSREISRPTNNPSSRIGEFAYIAIKELLKGPTEAEKNQGFLTLINTNTKVKNISIEDGVTTVDFTQALNEGMGGSCRVMTVRSQITETLKQFPEIKEVVISVNGDSQNILQP